MLHFLLFMQFLIFIVAQSFEYCWVGGSMKIPFSLNTYGFSHHKCGKGFHLESDGMCYKHTPSNSISYPDFEKQCKCEHGGPRNRKDNRVNNRMNNRYKRHLRGFPGIRYAAPYRPRPQYAQVQPPRTNNNYAYQAARAPQSAPQSMPLIDFNTYECIRHRDPCHIYPRPVDQGICPPGWIYLNNLGHNCFKFFPPQTWHEAERFCNSQNAHLASLGDVYAVDILADFPRQFFPNHVHRIQSHPLIIDEYHTWIGLNLTDRSNLTWTDGYTGKTWNMGSMGTSENIFDNRGGNEKCGSIVFKLDCNLVTIKITVQDSRCDEQKTFACKLNKVLPTSSPTSTTSPPTTVTTMITTTTAKQSETSTIIATTKKVRQTCIV